MSRPIASSDNSENGMGFLSDEGVEVDAERLLLVATLLDHLLAIVLEREHLPPALGALHPLGQRDVVPPLLRPVAGHQSPLPSAAPGVS
jgi:hypothetical protein